MAAGALLNVALSLPVALARSLSLCTYRHHHSLPLVDLEAQLVLLGQVKDAVLRLEITPNGIDSKNLKMKIAVKKDEVDMSRQVDGNPFIIKKQTETNLNVANGETIVISGLTKQQITDASSGIPGLKDVDGLGRLFRVDRKGNAMEEVLIFLTPTILPKR